MPGSWRWRWSIKSGSPESLKKVFFLMSLAPLVAAMLAWPLAFGAGRMRGVQLLAPFIEDSGRLTDEYLAARAFSSRKGPRGRARHAAP
jgi:hypothetical protein